MIFYRESVCFVNGLLRPLFYFFAEFPEFGAKVFCDFLDFEGFSAGFSGRAWKMLKNDTLIVKIGVDTADILAFWAWNEFLYFDCILVFWPPANSKGKHKHFALRLSIQASLQVPARSGKLLKHPDLFFASIKDNEMVRVVMNATHQGGEVNVCFFTLIHAVRLKLAYYRLHRMA